MKLFKRFLNRVRFRRKLMADESINVVDSMVKARKLYKELCIDAHPDRNGDRLEIAEDLMKSIEENRYNYSALLLLKEKVRKELC